MVPEPIDIHDANADERRESVTGTEAAKDDEKQSLLVMDQGAGLTSEPKSDEPTAAPPATAAAAPVAHQDALLQLQQTHDEYVKSSCEYEKELEGEIAQLESKVASLEQSTHAFELSREQLQTKLIGVLRQLDATRTRELVLQSETQELKWKVQRLEQTNDELETAARIARASIADLEHQNEKLLEQHVFLQHENEELARQLASITVAEVHPTDSFSSASSSHSNGSRASHKPIAIHGSGDSEKVHHSSGGGRKLSRSKYKRPQQHARGKATVPGRGRFPDVVESCLHITCRHCRHPSRSSSSTHFELRQNHLESPPYVDILANGDDPQMKQQSKPTIFERLRLRLRTLFDCGQKKQSDAAKSTPTR
uniref:Uncharacterized protein n=1 Tax=Globisporangium ultimum (strain ATCC 200006 / CBS 805.95 / DAOM BR144) TaxID=431595 RepID=K3WZG2_GLOUD